MAAFRGKGWVWPDRSRCHSCRSYMDFTVILGLFCSRECAGVPEMPDNVADWPRRCRVLVQGRWQPKAAFFTESEAKDRGRYVYLCELPDGCGMYHTSKLSAPYSELTSEKTGKET